MCGIYLLMIIGGIAVLYFGFNLIEPVKNSEDEQVNASKD